MTIVTKTLISLIRAPVVSPQGQDKSQAPGGGDIPKSLKGAGNQPSEAPVSARKTGADKLSKEWLAASRGDWPQALQDLINERSQLLGAHRKTCQAADAKIGRTKFSEQALHQLDGYHALMTRQKNDLQALDQKISLLKQQIPQAELASLEKQLATPVQYSRVFKPDTTPSIEAQLKARLDADSDHKPCPKLQSVFLKCSGIVSNWTSSLQGKTHAIR